MVSSVLPGVTSARRPESIRAGVQEWASPLASREGKPWPKHQRAFRPPRHSVSYRERWAGRETMGKVLVLYDSASGNTAKMAGLVADGAGSIPGIEVRLRRVD